MDWTDGTGRYWAILDQQEDWILTSYLGFKDIIRDKNSLIGIARLICLKCKITINNNDPACSTCKRRCPDSLFKKYIIIS